MFRLELTSDFEEHLADGRLFQQCLDSVFFVIYYVANEKFPSSLSVQVEIIS